MTWTHVIALLSVLVSLTVGLRTILTARRNLDLSVQNTDLTRIRDLRGETKELRTEVTELRAELRGAHTEIAQMRTQVTEMHEFANTLMRDRMEMIRYAQQPGTTINDWLNRYGDTDHPRPIGGTIDA